MNLPPQPASQPPTSPYLTSDLLRFAEKAPAYAVSAPTSPTSLLAFLGEKEEEEEETGFFL